MICMWFDLQQNSTPEEAARIIAMNEAKAKETKLRLRRQSVARREQKKLAELRKTFAKQIKANNLPDDDDDDE